MTVLNSDRKYNMSITELLDLFRRGLTALVPVADGVGISWRDGEAYDDWDEIATCLYERVVANSIKQACHSMGLSTINLAEYDMSLSSYSNRAYIRLEGLGIPEDAIAVFVRFSGVGSGFSDAMWIDLRDLGNGGAVITHRVDYSRCVAILAISIDGETRDIREITLT